MTRPMHTIARILKVGTLLSTVGFAACVLLQIFARLLLPAAPSWTEEAARLFFVLAVGCAAGPAVRAGAYVRFDILLSRLSPTARARLARAIDAATALLFALFTVAAVRFALMGVAERSPSLRFAMAVPFAGVVVLGVGVLAYLLHRVIRTAR